ncbi:MAG: RdgB/HAM1 family non-canonical purine NTP pyrophosphatase [Bacteroidota bacterium]
MARPKILFGTNNLHKLREIREIVGKSYEVLSLSDLGIEQDVAETETTLTGNALLKARAFHQLAGIPCFSDDTGLEVDALDGRPGVYSARYAGPACDANDNIDKLLEELHGQSERSARFRTVIAYIDGEDVHTFDGVAEGEILTARQGEGGFGYDPVFLPQGESRSFAELSPQEKNHISHRGKAVRAFSSFLLQS